MRYKNDSLEILLETRFISLFFPFNFYTTRKNNILFLCFVSGV